MTDSKLILTLKTLNKEELKAFRHFLCCKLFNKRESPILLFDYLKKELKASKPKLSKEIVFERLFPTKPYKEKEMREVMAYLSMPLHHFIAYQKLMESKEEETIAMCQALRKRKLFKQFEHTLKKASTLQQESTLRDSEYYYRNYRLEQERYYASTQKSRADVTNLKEVTQSLDISYFTNRLRQSCYMLSHQNTYNIDYDFDMVEQIIQEVKNKNLLHIPAISIYYYCYLAQVYPDQDAHFKALKQLLITHAELFTTSEMKDIYLLAINIAIKRYNRGYRDIVPDLLELYQSGIDQGVLLTNKVLSRFTYNNIVTLALTQKRFEWSKSFINNYASLLEAAYQEITYQYNLGKYYCEKKEFDLALKYLYLTASSDDVYINIDTKILLARVYYEQHDIDAQIALVDSFKKVLNRKKKILGYHHISYKNFLSCVSKLMALNPYDRSAQADLLIEIKNKQPIPFKHWFIEQLS